MRLLETAAVASGCFAGGCLATVPWHPTLWASVAFAMLAVGAAIVDTVVQALRPQLPEQALSARLEALEQQVDRLSKANAFKGLG